MNPVDELSKLNRAATALYALTDYALAYTHSTRTDALISLNKTTGTPQIRKWATSAVLRLGFCSLQRWSNFGLALVHLWLTWD